MSDKSIVPGCLVMVVGGSTGENIGKITRTVARIGAVDRLPNNGPFLVRDFGVIWQVEDYLAWALADRPYAPEQYLLRIDDGPEDTVIEDAELTLDLRLNA